MQKMYVVLLGMLLCLVGCNKNSQLGGTVTFTDDNSPLTVGSVMFATSSFEAKGIIGADGKYTMGTIDIKDGLPAGTYKVYISGAQEELPNGSTRSLIDPTYANFATTPLTCDVPANKNTFDIQVPKNSK